MTLAINACINVIRAGPSAAFSEIAKGKKISILHPFNCVKEHSFTLDIESFIFQNYVDNIKLLKRLGCIGELITNEWNRYSYIQMLTVFELVWTLAARQRWWRIQTNTLEYGWMWPVSIACIRFCRRFCVTGLRLCKSKYTAKLCEISNSSIYWFYQFTNTSKSQYDLVMCAYEMYCNFITIKINE